ncbi:tryptophan-rich antigen tryptophan-rich protein [Plasmodium vinckei brucechwatti]|uniref:Tryptophan-rich antigen tryptophan-rich protein n=1 Tax=Plasmodium vinckei brucechwatti TaxID=119398 RepID=A0A6V7SCG3_PLAVN|nr:tryptophan-rich antigen tryptophan-rich protein [Plasmodium vinckei brucechwatti]
MEAISAVAGHNTLNPSTMYGENVGSQILLSNDMNTSGLDFQNIPNVTNSTNTLFDSEEVDETLYDTFDESLINSDELITNEILVENAGILSQIIRIYSKMSVIKFNGMISKVVDVITPIIHYPLAHNAIAYSKVITEKLGKSHILLLKYKEELENLQIIQRLRDHAMNMHMLDNPLQLAIITFASLIFSFLLILMLKRIHNNIKFYITGSNKENKNMSENDVDNIEESEEGKEELWEFWKSELDDKFEEFNSKLEDDTKKMIELKDKEWNKWKENHENKWVHYNEHLERAYKKNVLTESPDFDDEQWAKWVKTEAKKSMNLEFKSWLLKTKYNMDKWTMHQWDNWKNNTFDEWLSSDWKLRENKYWKYWKYINEGLIKLYTSKFENLKKWENRLDREASEWNEWIEIKDYFFMNKKSNEWENFENDTTQNYEEWRNEFIGKLIEGKKWNVWKSEKKNYKSKKRKLKEKEKKEKEQKEKGKKSDLNKSSYKKYNSPNTENNIFNFASYVLKQWNIPISYFKPLYRIRNSLNNRNNYFPSSNRHMNNLDAYNNDYNLLNKTWKFRASTNEPTTSLNDNRNHQDLRNTDTIALNRWGWKRNNRNGISGLSYGIKKRLNTQNSDYNPMVDILKYMDTQSRNYNPSNAKWNHWGNRYETSKYNSWNP